MNTKLIAVVSLVALMIAAAPVRAEAPLTYDPLETGVFLDYPAFLLDLDLSEAEFLRLQQAAADLDCSALARVVHSAALDADACDAASAGWGFYFITYELYRSLITYTCVGSKGTAYWLVTNYWEFGYIDQYWNRYPIAWGLYWTVDVTNFVCPPPPIRDLPVEIDPKAIEIVA